MPKNKKSDNRTTLLLKVFISKELWRDANFSSEAISPTASAIMFDMLLPCPLRAKNVWQLRWLGSLSSSEIRELHKIHTCALYFDENKGCYTIFVHKQKLKNRKLLIRK